MQRLALLSARRLPQYNLAQAWRPALVSRWYSAAPEPLTVQDVETRVMSVLKDFSKVDASKVYTFSHA